MTTLLDGNVLIALSSPHHEMHLRARTWFEETASLFATCPMTQGTLLRFLLREGVTTSDAAAALDLLTSHPRHEFWPDDRPFDTTTLRGVIGHRQVTDAYLAGLTRARGGRLLTADGGLAALHHDVAHLL
jgi:hypothetical protein